MVMSRFILRFCLATTAFLVALSLPLAAQQLQLSGKVVDASGSPVPGATVLLESADGALHKQAISEKTGDFTFGFVLKGSYTVKVSPLNGFAEQQQDVALNANLVLPAIVLIPEVVTQTVEVSGGNTLSIDASSNKDSISVTGESLNHLPVFDQDIVGTISTFLDPSATSSSGVSIIVDGVEMKNVNISPSAIAEVRINSDPYSVEFASPGRGRIEITTKPGSDQYHGTLNFIARDSSLNAKNYFAQTKPAEQRRIYEGHLIGPVGHGGHTTFLLSGTRQEQDLQSAVHAFGPSGLIAENVATPSRNSQIGLRVTHDFSPGHRLSVAYTFHDNSSSNQGVGGIVLSSAGINHTNKQDNVVISDRIIVSPNIVQQLQVMLEHELDTQTSVTTGPSIQVQDAFTGGGAQGDVYRTEHTVGLIEVVAWTHGKHYYRFGVSIPQISRRAVNDHTNRQGTFNFSSLTDYANANPYRFTIQQGIGRGLYFASEIGTFAQDEISLRKNLQLTLGVRYQWQTYLTSLGNFAPRMSVAYAPSKQWIARAGIGVFYDRTGGDFPITFKLHNGVVLRQYQFLNPAYPVAVPPNQDLSGLPVSIVREQPSLRAPYQVQYSAGVERKLAGGMTATATYRGITGISSFRSRDANAPLSATSTARPNPSLGFVQQVEAAGRSTLNALDLGIRGRAGQWFEGQAQYTFSRAYNNTGGLNWYPQDQYAANDEWGRSDLDRRHRFNLLGSVHTGHWLSLGLATTLYTGTPYTELAGIDRYNTGLGNARPVGIGRNTLQSLGTATVDLLWDHDFHLGKADKGGQGKTINVSASGFNVLNHANFTSFIGNVRSPLFEQATIAQAGRQIQLGLRYQF